jgi:hypothetical protein
VLQRKFRLDLTLCGANLINVIFNTRFSTSVKIYRVFVIMIRQLTATEENSSSFCELNEKRTIFCGRNIESWIVKEVGTCVTQVPL